MKCPDCGSVVIDHLPSEGDTIRSCRECGFQWSTELPDSFLVLMAIEHSKERRKRNG